MESLSLQTRPRQSSALENWRLCRPSLKLQRISLGGIGTKTRTIRTTSGQAFFDRSPFSSTGTKVRHTPVQEKSPAALAANPFDGIFIGTPPREDPADECAICQEAISEHDGWRWPVCHVTHRFHAVCVARHRPVSEALAHLSRTGGMSRLSAATCPLCRRHWPDSAAEGEAFTALLAHLGFPLPGTGCPCGGCLAAGAGPEDSDVDDMWFAAVEPVAAQGEDEVMPGGLAPELMEQPLVLTAPMVPLVPPPEPEPPCSASGTRAPRAASGTSSCPRA